MKWLAINLTTGSPILKRFHRQPCLQKCVRGISCHWRAERMRVNWREAKNGKQYRLSVRALSVASQQAANENTQFPSRVSAGCVLKMFPFGSQWAAAMLTQLLGRTCALTSKHDMRVRLCFFIFSPLSTFTDILHWNVSGGKQARETLWIPKHTWLTCASALSSWEGSSTCRAHANTIKLRDAELDIVFKRNRGKGLLVRSPSAFSNARHSSWRPEGCRPFCTHTHLTWTGTPTSCWPHVLISFIIYYNSDWIKMEVSHVRASHQ